MSETTNPLPPEVGDAINELESAATTWGEKCETGDEFGRRWACKDLEHATAVLTRVIRAYGDARAREAAEQMRERCAAQCHAEAVWILNRTVREAAHNNACADCAKAIRALPITGDTSHG